MLRASTPASLPRGRPCRAPVACRCGTRCSARALPLTGRARSRVALPHERGGRTERTTGARSTGGRGGGRGSRERSGVRGRLKGGGRGQGGTSPTTSYARPQPPPGTRGTPPTVARGHGGALTRPVAGARDAVTRLDCSDGNTQWHARPATLISPSCRDLYESHHAPARK